ncbi:XRE family transcriptional regulator [Empedobacter tilapiae]|uniref:XRE family transcriptional regulator n=1 Tax=Empedobacter tilapiae TaxID=2491114 RepID=A0A4Z1C350_9FLAO|nr:XRE family transcriptional regulator [Empedobacter tilapiae]TGN26741.1 XRE family transcriptional regulator [Empedobacter tilapiae]
MNTIIDRILKIIELKKISKNKFYIETGLSNGFLDKVKDIGASKIEQILNTYSDINPNWLVTGEGAMFTNQNKEIEKSDVTDNITEEVRLFDTNQNAEIFTNTHGNKFYIYPDQTIRIEVLKIPFPAYASYIESCFDEIKLKEDFSTISFKVDHIGRGYYLGFESIGDSMWNKGGYDTPSGADILGREVGRHLWKDGFHKTTYGFIIITKTGIFHKDIADLTDDGMIVLTSRNPEFKPFLYPIEDVKQIFHVIKRSY